MYKSKFLESISIDQNVLEDFPKEVAKDMIGGNYGWEPGKH